MKYIITYNNNSTGEGITNLQPIFIHFNRLSDNTPLTPPLITEASSGFYEFDYITTDDCYGIIDGGSGLDASIRYQNVVLSVSDSYLDMPISNIIGGNGINNIVISLIDQYNNNIADVKGAIYDATNTNILCYNYSDSNGILNFNFDNGIYNLRLHKTLYNFDNQLLSVSGNLSLAVSGFNNQISLIPGKPDEQILYGTIYNVDSSPAYNKKVEITTFKNQLVESSGGSGVILKSSKASTYTDVNGFFQLTTFKNSIVSLKIGTNLLIEEFRTSDNDSENLIFYLRTVYLD